MKIWVIGHTCPIWAVYREAMSVRSPEATDDSADHSLAEAAFYQVLDTLTPREQKVLVLRFGLDDGREKSLAEVGKEINARRERVRQIEAKALRKLRHPIRIRKLEPLAELLGFAV